MSANDRPEDWQNPGQLEVDSHMCVPSAITSLDLLAPFDDISERHRFSLRRRDVSVI